MSLKTVWRASRRNNKTHMFGEAFAWSIAWLYCSTVVLYQIGPCGDGSTWEFGNLAKRNSEKKVLSHTIEDGSYQNDTSTSRENSTSMSSSTPTASWRSFPWARTHRLGSRRKRLWAFRVGFRKDDTPRPCEIFMVRPGYEYCIWRHWDWPLGVGWLNLNFFFSVVYMFFHQGQ